MKRLTEIEATKWSSERGLRVGQFSLDEVGFAGTSEERFRVQVPGETIAAVGLAYVVLMTEIARYDEANFKGGMIWVKRWEIWSESIDRVGYALLDGVTGASGQGTWLGETPGLIFSEDEFAQAHACLSLPILFQWDAYYFPAGAQFLAILSHHGNLQIVAREGTSGSLLQRFDNWKPEEM